MVVSATTTEILFIPRFGLQYPAANCARPQEGEGPIPQRTFHFFGRIFRLVSVTYVPLQPTLYLCLYCSFTSFVRSCSYSWHQYGRAFFSVQVQRWKVIFIALISLKDNENRDCLQRLGLWKWSNQCFEKGMTAVGRITVCRSEQGRSNPPSLTSSL